MIFVTVGTSSGDPLIKEIDYYASGTNDNIIAQIGNGTYIPKNMHFFRFADSLSSYYEKADLIIGQGGAGTIFEVLTANKPFIGVSNHSVRDNHQEELLNKLCSEGFILWCKDYSDLPNTIRKASTFAFRKYFPPDFYIDTVLLNFLRGSDISVKYAGQK
jgi:UDP-N-acetylglucosamine transferase subunit ALG13